MSKIIFYREKFNLTQQELAEKAGVSVRTIQRIEAGAKLKGHTLSVIAKALNVSIDELVESKNEKELNIKLIKLINLSSLPFVVIPLANILIPLLLIHIKKEKNVLTKQIVSVQIMWTIIASILFILSPFASRIFSSGIKLTLPVLMISVLVNIVIILINTRALDKNKKMRIYLDFSFI
ncbi:helix-turn-helix domain-containing protein [Aquimarina rhabdastrellae]